MTDCFSHVHVSSLTLSPSDLISISPCCLLYNCYDFSLENLVLNQLIIPHYTFVIILAYLHTWYCINIVRRNSVLVTDGSLRVNLSASQSCFNTGTYPLIIKVSSVRYTLRCVRATVSLNLSGRSSFSRPLRLDEWYRDTLMEGLKLCISGRSMVLELCSPLDPRVCSKSISTFRDLSKEVDLFTAL